MSSRDDGPMTDRQGEPPMHHMIELRLTGTAVRTLADNNHLRGFPNRDRVAAILIRDDDPDRDLNRATAFWYTSHVRTQRIGKGIARYGKCTPRDARLILEYLESVAGVLRSGDDPGSRAEGRAVGRAVDQAVSHLRRAGVPVVERQRGPFTDFEIGGPQS
jgi:hypothetical protein